MSTEIFNHVSYPSKEARELINKRKRNEFNKIAFDLKPNESHDIMSFDAWDNVDLREWLRAHNNRAFDMSISYILLIHQYNQGIPDKEWFISPGSNGDSIEYFPHFEVKNYSYHYWFGYYAEKFYSQFSGIIDSIYHIINQKYKFGHKPKSGFKINIAKDLQSTERDLYDILENFREEEEYKKLDKYRNDLIHNFSPNQIDQRTKRTEGSNGSTILSITVGEYTTTEEFLKNIECNIDLLANLIESIKPYIETK